MSPGPLEFEIETVASQPSPIDFGCLPQCMESKGPPPLPLVEPSVSPDPPLSRGVGTHSLSDSGEQK